MNVRTLLFCVFVFGTCLAHAQQMTDSKKLRAAIDEYAQGIQNLDAFNADYFSVEANLDKFGDYPSEDFYNRFKRIIETGLEKIKTVKYEKLADNEQIDYRLFKNDLEVALRQFDFPLELLDFNQMSNRLSSFIDQANPAISSFPFDSVRHYEAFLKRSEGFPAYVDRQIAVLKRGIEKKITQSCRIVEKTSHSYKKGMIGDAEKNPFYLPVKAFPPSIDKKDQARLREGFKQMIRERIVPGFKKFDAFFQGEYKAHCRKEFGIGQLPNAKALYAYAIRAQTDTDMPPEKIHETGVAEVARIEAEMAKVQKQLGVKGTRPQFLKSLLSDSKYFFSTEKQLVESFQRVRGEVEKQLPKYFDLLPKTDFKIVKASNPEDAAGVYHQPTELQPIGRFVYNATHLRQIPRYEVTTLLMHETVPGHHLQLALAYELKDQLSEYRRKVFNSTAFVEGWALYSESLGYEMGLYKDPVQRLGNLNDELLRAVRLVVDTGIHSKGWTHDQTVAYMKEHLASDASDIEIEANRYSVWPGQALAYKIGQLKILELRHRAEKELGSHFDVRAFHRTVIGMGTLSLPVLEDEVARFIKKTKTSLQNRSANARN